MALIIRDGFDFYSIITDAGLNYWRSASGTLGTLSATTRFGTGKSLSKGSSNVSGPILGGPAYGANEATNFVVCAVLPNFAFTTAHDGWGFRWFDGATVQCSLYFNVDGSIRFYRGDKTTLLATFAGAQTSLAWTQYQIKVIVDNTVGEIHIRKNGATSDDYSSTGLDCASTANNYATSCDVANGGGAGDAGPYLIDDLAIYTGSGSAPWNDWVGDIRAIQVMPSADSSVQFTKSASTIVEGNTTATTTRTIGTNLQSTLLAFTPSRSGKLANLILQFNAGATGACNCAIFDSAGIGGGPGSVLTNGTCTPVTNPVINANTFTFATPPDVVMGTTYWLMFITNVSSTLKSTTGNVQQYTQTKTYSAGAFDSPMTLTSVSLTPACVTATINIASNYQLVMELSQDGATSYVYDSTVGHVDLYAPSALPFTPTSILGLSVRGFASKSDAGARSGAFEIVSGAVTTVGPTLALPTSFQNMLQVQDTDPNTTLAWTPTGIGSATFGPKVIV